MADSDIALLHRFVDGDDGAFGEIVQRHAGQVYWTCMRVLADAEKAADATQETFFQLMKRADGVNGSLGGWLHRVAVRKSADSIRGDVQRRKREETYLDVKAESDPTWREVSPHVDEALDQLDGLTRDLLIRHFLEGCSMTDIARELEVSRPTISRRIDSGLARIRAHLSKRGVLVTAGGLSVLLVQDSVRSVPQAVLDQLGRMAVVGASTTGAAVMCGVLAAANTKLIAVVVVVVAIGSGWVAYKGLSSHAVDRTPPSVVNRDEGRFYSGSRESPRQTEPANPVLETETPQSRPGQEVPVIAPPSAPQVGPKPVQAQAPVPAGPESQNDALHMDLSSPEATARSFTRAIVLGNADTVMACFLPGGVDYDDIQEMLAANPDDPKQRSKYEMKLWLQSLDPDAEMPIVETKEAAGATQVVWRVTFKSDVKCGGRAFYVGDTFDLDATVRRSGDAWLIDNF